MPIIVGCIDLATIGSTDERLPHFFASRGYAEFVEARLVKNKNAITPECVACGRECPPHRRWCSLSCYYAEDGYPDEDQDEDDDD